jgi:hypothetical protein
MIECPKCGLVQPARDDCPGCGIVFARFAAAASRAAEEPVAAPDDPTWEGAWFPDEDEVAPASPLRLVSLLLLLALVTVAAYLEYSRHTDAFGVAENAVLSSPDIRVVLGADRGDELRVGYFFRGQARGRGSSAQGRFLFRVIGPGGQGSALVHLIHRAGRWRAIQVDFLDPRGRTRSLEVQEAKVRRPHPAAGQLKPLPASNTQEMPPQVPEETSTF